MDVWRTYVVFYIFRKKTLLLCKCIY